MRHFPPLLLSSALLLSACGSGEGGTEGDATAAETEALGSYTIDPESGEVRATHTDAAGVTTTMRAGENVPVRWPDPFTAYPGAEITNTTRVEQGEGAFVTVEFTTPDARPDVVEFYRKQAVEAGIEPEIEVSGGETTTLGGENRDRKASFALQVTRVDGRTEGQISVTRGFD
ncbi:hypothetical protein KUW15_10975 [Qipengyuania aquimaris]|uniref:hypothetical protein n=1 Tax=Qipengyuania aquimaris TaxID=255984 RepID=UPI001C9806CD|nr:hypothetical protein [Qipengyuania aquimaris]MBY6129238.1 hypothetical protein [Qipengyuania aquimaris]